jgi:hypothetical protein
MPNFLELRKDEVRRISLPRTPMNKGIKRRAPQDGRIPALYFRALLRENGARQLELAKI